MRAAFIGFGELAIGLAPALVENGAEVRAYTRPRAEAAGEHILEERLARARVMRSGSLADALREAGLVISAVPAGESGAVAAAAAPLLAPGSVYVDVAPVLPEEKAARAALVDARGVHYVDVAVLGTVATEGSRVPLLASGAGAAQLAEIGGAYGLQVSLVPGPAGQASLVKLLRSVYMKGRDALILEMILAARRYGLEAAVIESIGGRGEQVTFLELTTRVLCALAIHSGRRADELGSSAAVVARAGVDPLVAEAGERRLRRLAELGLRERFGGERPSDLNEVLEALDGVAPERPACSGAGA